MSSQIYLLADTLAMNLYTSGAKIVGASTKFVETGPLDLSLNMMVFSDVVGPVELSAFVKFGRHLWGYIITKAGYSLIYFFDGEEAELTPKTAYNYGGVSNVSTLLKISAKTPIVAVFLFRQDGWKKLTEEEAKKEVPTK